MKTAFTILLLVLLVGCHSQTLRDQYVLQKPSAKAVEKVENLNHLDQSTVEFSIDFSIYNKFLVLEAHADASGEPFRWKIDVYRKTALISSEDYPTQSPSASARLQVIEIERQYSTMKYQASIRISFNVPIPDHPGLAIFYQKSAPAENSPHKQYLSLKPVVTSAPNPISNYKPNKLTPLTNRMVPQPGFVFEWEQDASNPNQIIFQVTWPQVGWLGVGFGASMNGTDMAIFQSSTAPNSTRTVYSVSDYYSFTQTRPFLNTQSTQNLNLIDQSVDGQFQISQVRFSRNLTVTPSTTNVTYQGQNRTETHAQLQFNKTFNFIMAHGTPSTLSFHGQSEFHFSVYLSSGCPQSQVLIGETCQPSNVTGPLQNTVVPPLSRYQVEWEFDQANNSNIIFQVVSPVISNFALSFGPSIEQTDTALFSVFQDQITGTSAYYTDKTVTKTNFLNLQILGYKINFETQTYTVKFSRALLVSPQDGLNHQNLSLGGAYNFTVTQFTPQTGFNNITSTHVFGVNLIKGCPLGQVLFQNACTKLNFENLSSSSLFGKINLQWQIYNETNEVLFFIQYPWVSWMILGFGASERENYIAAFSISQNAMEARSYFQNFTGRLKLQDPANDPQSLTLMAYEINYSENITRIQFSRKMKFDSLQDLQLESDSAVSSRYDILPNKTYQWYFRYQTLETSFDGQLSQFDNTENFTLITNETCPYGQMMSSTLNPKTQTTSWKCEPNDINPLLAGVAINNNEWSVQWSFDPNDSKYIIITLFQNQLSWMGLGFSYSMDQTSYAVANIDSCDGNPCVRMSDLWSIAQHKPNVSVGNPQGIQLLGYDLQKNSTFVKFKRLLVPNTNETSIYATIVPGASYTWIVASSPQNQLGYHGSTKTSFALTLYEYGCPANQGFNGLVCRNCLLNELLVNGACISVCSGDQFYYNKTCNQNNVQPLSAVCNLFQKNTTLSWQFNSDGKTADFFIQWNSQSYIGLGFASTMKNTDMVIITLNGGIPSVKTYYSTGEDWPTLANPDFLQLQILGFQVKTSPYQVKFRRLITPLNTGGQTHQTLTANGSQDFCYAFMPGSQQLNFHQNYHYSFEAILYTYKSTQSAIPTEVQEISLHRYFMFWIWAVGVDIGLIMVRQFKTFKFYMEFHAIFMFILCGLSVSMEIVILDYSWGSLWEDAGSMKRAHLIIGLIMLGLTLFQIVSGILTRLQIFNTKDTYKNLKLYKLIHQILGIIFYLAGKWQVISGKWVYGNYMDLDANQNLLDGVYVIIGVFGARILIELLYAYPPAFLLNCLRPAPKSSQQLQLDPQGQDLVSLIESYRWSEIRKQYPQEKLCLLGNKIISLKDIIHPGGLFIFEAINGREIDRFVYGGYALDRALFPMESHLHSPFAFIMMEKNCIGELSNLPHSYVCYAESKDRTLLNSAGFSIRAHKLVAPNIMQIELVNRQFVVQNNQSGIAWIGRYFQITTNHPSAKLKGKKRLYTSVLCMTKANQEYRERLVRVVGQIDVLSIQLDQTTLGISNAYSEALPLILKKYENPKEETFSGFVHGHAGDESIVYEVSGPLGQGLQLTGSDSGNLILFAGGTGLFPFLDFLDFMLKKALVTALVQVRGQGILEFLDPSFKTILNSNNGIKVFLYASFKKDSEFVGRDIVESLYHLNDKFNLNLFDCEIRFSDTARELNQSDKDSSAGDTVIRNTIQNPDSKKLGYLPTVIERFDEPFMQERIDRWTNSSNGQRRFLICGDPTMMKVIPRTLMNQGVSRDEIHYV